MPVQVGFGVCLGSVILAAWEQSIFSKSQVVYGIKRGLEDW